MIQVVRFLLLLKGKEPFEGSPVKFCTSILVVLYGSPWGIFLQIFVPPRLLCLNHQLVGDRRKHPCHRWRWGALGRMGSLDMPSLKSSNPSLTKGASVERWEVVCNDLEFSIDKICALCGILAKWWVVPDMWAVPSQWLIPHWFRMVSYGRSETKHGSSRLPSPKTNISPKNGWLEYDPFLLGFGLFSGANR